MQTELIKEIDQLEKTHWWHIGKKEIICGFVDDYLNSRRSGGKPSSKPHILEIGAGPGNILATFNDVATTYALDPDKNAIAFARSRKIKHVFATTLEKFSSAQKFDVIIAADVLEHIKDDKAALTKMHQLLVPGGLLVLHVPANQKLFSYWDKALGHFRRYEMADLTAKVSRHFVIDFASYRVCLPYPVARLARLVKARVSSQSEKSDFRTLAMFNWLAAVYMRMENFLTRRLRLRLPFGLSIIVVASKKF